ncbi:hypothetical protein N8714_02580 [Rhodobacteraceae bacterium]|nr:hypothetical protein [Paracoccaceae bacterium]
MIALRLNLVIQENSVELLKYEVAGHTVIKSSAIHKGDVTSALRELSAFIFQKNDLNHNVDFVVPPNQIKIFRKIQKNTKNREDTNSVAKKFLNKETDVDISEVFFDVSAFEDSIEIAVVDRQKLLEAILFIESTGFKIVNTISMSNDRRKSFVFRSQKDFERQSEIKIQSYFENWLKGQEIIRFLKSKILITKNVATSKFARNLALLSFALLVTVVVATEYFNRSFEKKREPISYLKNDSARSIAPNKEEIVNTVFSPINVFIHSEKIQLFSSLDNPLRDLASSPDTTMPKDRSVNLAEISFNKELNFGNKINFDTTDISTIKIYEPWIYLATLEQNFLSSSNPEKKLIPAIQDAKKPSDPTINFINISPLVKNGNKNSRPELNLVAPLNKIRIYPKLRPNKYPFEVKEIPKQYARPRVRPTVIEELAAKSQIFSDSQIGLSVKPKNRPKIRKRIAVADYSEEGDEATITGTISKAATKKSIVKIATTENAINKSKLNLLSIYSRGSERRAIVRFPTGQTKLVKVGDALDGGRVAAIGNGQVRYIKGGNNLVLKIPEG